MEFHEKLQQLRHQKGLTQEELAQALYVSRTAVSKWESGRGYPGIDSLKALARFYGVTVDALLSGEELLTVAEEDHKQKDARLRDTTIGLLDCSTLLFLFLPLFRQTTDGMTHAVSLLALTEVSSALRIVYFTAILAIVLCGIVTPAFQHVKNPLWQKIGHALSFLLGICGVLLFIISPQPYAAALLFVFLLIKTFLCIRRT